MLLKSGTKTTKKDPNFVLQMEGTDKRFRYIVPVLTKARSIQVISSARQSGAFRQDEVNLAIMDAVYGDIVNLDKLSIWDVFKQFNVSDDQQTAVVDKIAAIAGGEATDDAD